MTDVMKALKSPMDHVNNAERELRQFRSDLDNVTYTLPPELKPVMDEASNESTLLLKRVFKLQEVIRLAAIPETKAGVTGASK
jgi:mRNA-degrading endonuclease HigB of HigAB toxin-antitoxin module